MRRIYFDGGCVPNPGQMEICVVVEGGQTIRKRIGIGTNNIAEWSALIRACQVAIGMGLEEVEIVGDSQMVINQANGAWKIKQEHLKPFKAGFNVLAANIPRLKLTWVPREVNKAGWVLES